MSMKTFAVSDYGLYVVATDIESYAKTQDMDASDLLFEIGNYYGDAKGECYLLTKADESFHCDESFAILPLEKHPTLFAQAYENIEAALHELKENYAELLPDDFDYDGKFVRLVGTVYG